jgi:DNA polymerase-3 subunit beta
MELKLDRAALLGALYKAQGVVDRRSTVNTLSHVLLETTEHGEARVVATDYDVVLEATLACEVLQPGRACINGKSFFDVVKNVEDAQVHVLGLPNHWAEIVAGRSRFKLSGVASEEFPVVPEAKEVRWVGLPRAILRDLVEKTAFSMSEDETRMALNGVLLRMSPAEQAGMVRVTVVSTDGHRLSKAECTTEAQGYDGGSHEAIVHRRGVTEVRRLLEEDTVHLLEVGFARGQVLFRAGGTTFTVRQIEDQYPDYQRAIPPSTRVKLGIDRQQLASAIRRIAVLTSSKTCIIRVSLEKGCLALASQNPDYGEGRDEIDVAYDGPELVVGFNYVYLLEVLGVLKGHQVAIEFTDEFGPSVLSAPDEPGALFVVMPMRI